MSTITLFEEYLQNDTDVYTSRPTVEEGHSRPCLASAMIAAVENYRDAEGITDHDFRLWAQDNGVLETADGYLSDELSDCKCPPRKRIYKHYFTLRLHYGDGHTEKEIHFCDINDAVLEVTDVAAYTDDVKSYDVTFAPYGGPEHVVYMSLEGNN